MTRLTDLKPRWVLPSQWSEQASPVYIGLSFQCPHCQPSEVEGRAEGKRQRLTVLFWPPIDPANLEGLYGAAWLAALKTGTPHARTSGITFDALTLSPSIGFDQIGHWHGHIINGDCLP